MPIGIENKTKHNKETHADTNSAVPTYTLLYQPHW